MAARFAVRKGRRIGGRKNSIAGEICDPATFPMRRPDEIEKECKVLDRRRFIGAGAAASGALIGGGAAAAQTAKTGELAPTKDGYTTLGPDEALDYLIRGNRAFLEDKTFAQPIDSRRRLDLAKG